MLSEIGEECEKEQAHKSDVELIFSAKAAISGLAECLSKESEIEARTEYFTAVLRLAQIGYRFDLTARKRSFDLSEDSLEVLKKVNDKLYEVDAELQLTEHKNTQEKIEESIHLIDSVILEMEIAQ